MEEEQKLGDSAVGIVDDLGESIIEEQKKQLQTEIDLFEKNIADAKKAKENYEKQVEIEEKLRKIVDENYGLIEEKYQHKYQLIPEYWELQHEKFKYQLRQERFMDERTIAGFDQQIKEQSEQLKSATEKLKELNEDE